MVVTVFANLFQLCILPISEMRGAIETGYFKIYSNEHVLYTVGT